MLNTGHYLTFTTVLTLVFCGLTQYITGIGSILWLPCIFAMLMVVLQIMQSRYKARPLDKQEWAVILLFVGCFGLALISTFLQSGPKVTIIGFKNSIALSLIMYCLVLGFVNESQYYRTSKVLYYIYYAQFPAILYQIFVVVPQRVAIKGEFEKWDSVVGTFGGDPMSGGNSAAMGMFCLLIMLMKLSEYKHGTCSKGSMLAHSITAFFICILGEIKFVILLAPFMMAYVWMSKSYMKGMKTYSVKTVLIIVLASGPLLTLAVYLLGLSYSSAFASDPTKSPFLVFWESIDYVFDPNYVMESGQLGRVTSMIFWLTNSDIFGLGAKAFGYGLNATNDGSALAPGILTKVFSVDLDGTSLSIMLWEAGSVSTSLYIIMILLVFFLTKPKPTFEPDQLDTDEIRFLSIQPVYRAFMLVCLLSIPYSTILVMVPVLQFLFYFSMGGSLIIRRTVLTHLGK